MYFVDLLPLYDKQSHLYIHNNYKILLFPLGGYYKKSLSCGSKTTYTSGGI